VLLVVVAFITAVVVVFVRLYSEAGKTDAVVVLVLYDVMLEVVVVLVVEVVLEVLLVLDVLEVVLVVEVSVVLYTIVVDAMVDSTGYRGNI
jgi:hypothetical protein